MPAVLKSLPPRRTQARETLASAIAEHAKAISKLSRLKAALNADSLYGDDGALRKFERAEAVFEEAKAIESHHLAAVALGEATAEQNPVKLAERSLAEAQSRLDGARKTLRALEDQLKATETELKSADDDLDEAVRNVMRDEAAETIDRILAEAAALQEQLGVKRAILRFLNAECFDGARELAQPIADFLAAPLFPHEFNGRSKDHPALGPWHTAREALKQNADVPLPTN
jgi:DNA repair exonuclease SbcCD ATPase subunit